MTAIDVVRTSLRGWRQYIIPRYRIVVDDVEVVSIREGESCSVEVAPGEHEVPAELDLHFGAGC
jgi:hypothetical protein